MSAGNPGLREIVLADAARDWMSLWPDVVGGRADLLQALARAAAVNVEARVPDPGEGGWSVFEITRHVLAYTGNVLAIIEATACGEQAIKDPMGTVADTGPAPYAEVFRMLVDRSADLASVHLRMPERPDMETTVDHPALGPLHCRAWFAFLRMHDTSHLESVERIVAALDPAES